MPTSRCRWALRAGLSGAAARRLLDGGDDGPPPLPQLLGAATAPATAAELEGEAAARAAFRSSVHAVPVPLGPRRARAKTATAIVTAKIIAAVALTAGTAGGVALATNSYSVHLQQSPAVSGADTAAVRDVFPSGNTTSTRVPSTHAPDGAARSGSSTGTGEAAGDGTGPSSGPEAPSPGPSGRCAAPCTTRTAEGPLTPSAQPDQQAGNPQAGNGNKPEKKNTGNGNNSQKEKNADNGNNRDKVKHANNGNDSDEGKGGNNGTNSGSAKNSGKNDKDGGAGQSGPGSNQADVEKGSGKKKADAETITTT